MKNPIRKKLRDKVITSRDNSIEGFANSIAISREMARYMQHEHFTAEEKAAAAEYNKPLLRFNVMVSKLQTLLGQEQLNRREAKIISDYEANEELIRVISNNFDYIQEFNDLRRKEASVMLDGLIYPIGGYIRRKIELNDQAYLDFNYTVLDSFGVHPDKSFSRYDMSDCRYVVFDEWMGLDEIRETFKPMPGATGTKDRAWWEELESSLTSEAGNDDYKVGDKYLVCQMEERRFVTAYICDVEGEVLKLTEKDLERYEQNGKKPSVIRKDKTARIYVTTVVPYFDDVVVQDEEFPFPTDRFSVFPYFGFDWNMPRSKVPSLAYLMQDVQDRINKGKSQEVDYLSQMLGGKWHIHQIETDAIKALKASKGQPEAIIPYKNPKNQAVRDIPSEAGSVISTVSNGVANDLGFIDDVSNITASMQGQTGKSGESGILFEQRRNQSLTSTNCYFENLAQTRELIARDYVELCRYVYFESDRLLKTKDPKGGFKYDMLNLEYGEEILNNLREASLRAVLDEGENTPNRQEKAFNETLALINMMKGMGAGFMDVPFDLLIKNSGVRDKQDWMQFIRNSQMRQVENQAADQANNEMNVMLDAANKV